MLYKRPIDPLFQVIFGSALPRIQSAPIAPVEIGVWTVPRGNKEKWDVARRGTLFANAQKSFREVGMVGPCPPSWNDPLLGSLPHFALPCLGIIFEESKKSDNEEQDFSRPRSF